jgi:hypothetical protein
MLLDRSFGPSFNDIDCCYTLRADKKSRAFARPENEIVLLIVDAITTNGTFCLLYTQRRQL